MIDCNQKRRVHTSNEQPDKIADPHGIQVSQVLNLPHDLWSFLSDFVQGSVCMHTQVFTHTQLAYLKHPPLWSWNSELAFQLQKCTETNCLRSLADLPPIGQLTRLGLFGQELLVYTDSTKPISVSSTKCHRDTLTTLCSTRSLCVANLKVLISTRTSNGQTAELHPPNTTHIS
jgi:hypothetical protein